MLITLGLADPAARLIRGIGSLAVELALVGNALRQRDRALAQAAQRRDQLEDGTGGVLGRNGAVEHGVAIVGGDFRPSAGIDRGALEDAQVERGIRADAQNLAVVGIHGDHCAGFGKGNLIAVFAVVRQRGGVYAVPAQAGIVQAVQNGVLRVVNLLNRLRQRFFHDGLQRRVDVCDDGVAVLGRDVGKLAHDGA